MKIDVIEKKDNPFLKRTDLMLMVDHTGQPTPKKDEMIKEIAKKFKSVPEKVTIDYIFSEAGISRSKVKAEVWKEKAPEKKVKKREEKVKEEPKKEKIEEEPVEKKPEEKPKKEKVEEKPKEEKKEVKVKEKPGEKKVEKKGEKDEA